VITCKSSDMNDRANVFDRRPTPDAREGGDEKEAERDDAVVETE
jgi:hypothetical protein